MRFSGNDALSVEEREKLENVRMDFKTVSDEAIADAKAQMLKFFPKSVKGRFLLTAEKDCLYGFSENQTHHIAVRTRGIEARSDNDINNKKNNDMERWDVILCEGGKNACFEMNVSADLTFADIELFFCL